MNAAEQFQMNWDDPDLHIKIDRGPEYSPTMPFTFVLTLEYVRYPIPSKLPLEMTDEELVLAAGQPSGSMTASFAGTVAVMPGETRLNVFNIILAECQARRNIGPSDSWAIVYYQLEPNGFPNPEGRTEKV